VFIEYIKDKTLVNLAEERVEIKKLVGSSFHPTAI